MSRFTPGPWTYELGASYQWRVRGPSRNKNGNPARIAVLGSPRVFESSIGVEDEANARLIAAAPEMLSAIARLADDLEDGHWSETKAYLRELIAAATGEPA